MRKLTLRLSVIVALAVSLGGSYLAADATECLNYESLQIAQTGQVILDGGARDVAVDGDRALVAGPYGVEFIDISDPAAPVVLSVIPGSLMRVALAGDLAVVSNADSRLIFFDVTDAATPVAISSVQLTGLVDHIDLHDGRVLVAGYVYGSPTGRLRLVDASDPGMPILDAVLELDSRALDVESSDDYAYVSVFSDGVAIVDLTTPHALALIETIPAELHAWGLALADQRLYVTESRSGVRIFDLADGSDPQLVGVLPMVEPKDVAVAGSLALICRSGDAYVLADVSDPSQPRVLGSYPKNGNGSRVSTNGELFCVADYDRGLCLVEPDPSGSQGQTSFRELDDFIVEGMQDGSLAATVHDGQMGWTLLSLDGDIPLPLATVATDDRITGLLIDGDRAYVAMEPNQLLTYSLIDPQHPELLAAGTVGTWTHPMAMRDGYLIANSMNHALLVYDVSNPAAPVVVADPAPCPGQFSTWTLQGDLIWSMSYGGGIYGFDISMPTAPVRLPDMPGQECVGLLASAGTTLYMATSWSGLFIYDYSDPTSPQLVSQWMPSVYSLSLSDVVYSDNHLYLADLYTGIRCVDVTDPYAPVDRGQYVTRDYVDGFLKSVDADDPQAFACGGRTIETIPWQCSSSAARDVIPPATAGLDVSVYPNPFNPRCTLKLVLVQPDVLNVVLYDLGGHRVCTLAAGRPYEAGGHELVWNGTDDSGRAVPSGQYVARITGDRVAAGRKLLLLR